MCVNWLPERSAAARVDTVWRAGGDGRVQSGERRMLRNIDGFEPQAEIAHGLGLAVRAWARTGLRNAFREGWRRAKREQLHLDAPPPDIPPRWSFPSVVTLNRF